MANLDEHKALGVTKILLLGDSGSGKTGALASLANAGYNVRILDFDNGAQILRTHVKPEFKKNVDVQVLTDKFRTTQAGIMCDGVPTAFSRGMRLLDKWVNKDDGIDFGSVASWGDKDVVVIDSLTFMGEAAFRYILAVNSRLGPAGTPTGPRPQDWGEAMRLQEGVLGLLFSDSIRCHVVITAHVVSLKEDDPTRYPSALGKKLPPKVGRYFNTVVLCKAMGSGQSTKRIITTVPEPDVTLKSPVNVPANLPLDTGLATLFATIRGSESA